MLGQAARSRLLLLQRAPAALSSATTTAAAVAGGARRRPLHHLAGAGVDAPRRLRRERAAATGGARGRALIPMGSGAANAAPSPWKGVAGSSRRALSSQAAHRGLADVDVVPDAGGEDLPVPMQPPQQQHQHQQRQPAEYYRAHQDGVAPREGPEHRVSVMAFYVGQKLDLISVRGSWVLIGLALTG